MLCEHHPLKSQARAPRGTSTATFQNKPYRRAGGRSSQIDCCNERSEIASLPSLCSMICLKNREAPREELLILSSTTSANKWLDCRNDGFDRTYQASTPKVSSTCIQWCAYMCVWVRAATMLHAHSHHLRSANVSNLKWTWTVTYKKSRQTREKTLKVQQRNMTLCVSVCSNDAS